MSMLSSATQPGLEDFGAATSHPKIYQIYQLYVRGDRDWVAERERAKACSKAWNIRPPCCGT